MKNTFAYLTKEQYNGIDRFQENEYGVDNKTICFIADTNEIYTHGKSFGKGGNGDGTVTIDGLTINVILEGGNPVISPTNLPKAGINKLGILGLKMGGGVKIDNNTMIYVDPAETLQTIKNYIDEHPTTEVPLTPATKTKLGGVIVGDGLSVASNGKISANVQEIKNMFTDAGITFNGASKLSDLEDVDGTPVTGQVLKWNGSKWTPALDETSTGEGGTPSQYVIGWSDDGDDVTFADNKNNTVTISKSGSNTPGEFDIDDIEFGLSIDEDELSLLVDGINRSTVTLPGEITITQDIIPARTDRVGGLRAISVNESNSTEATVLGEIWNNEPYGETDNSIVLPLMIDDSKEAGYIDIPKSLFGGGTGGGGTTVVANPGGTDGDTLTRIKIGNYNYNIPVGNILGLSNAFSRVTVGDTNIDASGSDSFSLVAGTNVTITPNASNNTITISAIGGGDGETTYIENPYDDSWKDAALNRITAAENSLNSIHNWTENEINALAKTQVDTYKTKIDDVGRWIMTGDLDDELADRFVTLGYTLDETVAWSTLSQKVDLIEASVNSVTQTENNHYTALNSSLNTQITKINGLETSVANLGTSYATLNEDADALSWLASYYNSMTDQTKTMAQVFSDVQTAAGLAATAAVQTQISTLDGRVTSAETSLASMVTDVNNLKSNSAGYLTSATLEGAVATMFANSTNGTSDSGKGKVAAFIEARVGDMVSSAAQGNGALSELVLSADQIMLDGDTTIAGALEADYINSILSESDYLRVHTADTGILVTGYGITFDAHGDTPANTDTLFRLMTNWNGSPSIPVFSSDRINLTPTRGSLVSNGCDITDDSVVIVKDNIQTSLGNIPAGQGFSVEYGSSHSRLDSVGEFIGTGKVNDTKAIVWAYISGSGNSATGKLDIWGENATKKITLDPTISSVFDGNVTFNNNVTVTGTFFNTASGSGSDIRYKNIVDDVHMDIADIAAAPKFTYTNKDDLSGKIYVGTSAQYWQDILPESVIADENGRLYMQYGNAALVAAISAAEEIVALKNEIAELKQQIAALTSNN